METLYLAFNVKGQLLTRTDSYPVYSGSINFVGAKFTFDWHWYNTNRYAQFVVGEDTYTKDIINGVCSVPWECFENAGTFTVTVFGGTLITANAVTVTVLQSAIQPDQLPNEPTPGYFDEVVTIVNGAKTDTLEAANDAETAQGLSEAARDDARKWADGTNAESTDLQYDNHAKYHSEESKAWAVGTENTEAEQYDNNAKYYSDNAKTSAENAKTSETNAGESEVSAAEVLADMLAMLGTDIATLVGGKVPITQIPATAIHDVLVVTNESELVTLTAQKGDVAQLVETVNEVPTITKSWQLLADDATVASNWVIWGTSYAVQAGNATTATNAENANTINNHRIIAMTEAQYQAAISAGTINETTIYLVGV